MTLATEPELSMQPRNHSGVSQRVRKVVEEEEEGSSGGREGEGEMGESQEEEVEQIGVEKEE